MTMPAKTIMVVGSSSSVGKSLLVAALCRIYARRGLRVAPFKAQNMSNNAAVCTDGAEIGRAQAVQAAAAGILPTAEMNPVLLKPEADARSQVIVLGRSTGSQPAGDYYHRRDELWKVVTGALDHLRQVYDLVIIEGAGSPAELNLKQDDIVNMSIAGYAHSPVLLVGDIDRGGIFAQLLGTFWLLEPAEQALIKGLVVNKFRGDPLLFSEGIRILEEKSSLPVLGVIPYLQGLGLPEEDAVAIDEPRRVNLPVSGVDIAVIRLPHIANFDDFDPLAAEPGVQVRYVSSGTELRSPQAVILPGTKNTAADLDWLNRVGLSRAILSLAALGKSVVGICGGYQMLGQAIFDPHHIESAQAEMPGLGLLDHQTTFMGEKETHPALARVTNTTGWMSSLNGMTLLGYEIHMGRTQGFSPWMRIVERQNSPVDVADGSVSTDGRIWGCYLHGLFENEAFQRAWLSSLGWAGGTENSLEKRHEQAFNRLADGVQAALDISRLDKIIGLL